MINSLFRRIAIEISFFKSSKSSLFTIDPVMRSLSKKYDEIDEYLDFFALAREKFSLPTDTPINFRKDIKFGYNSKNIRRKLLNYLAYYSGSGLLKSDILLYEYNYRGYPAKIEFHLYENKLFHIECNLGDIVYENRQELLQEIKDQFKVQNLDTEKQKIIDPDGHILTIENGTDFKILLADTGNRFFTELSNIEIFYNKKQSADTKGKVVYQTTNQNKDFSEVKNTG